MYNLNFNTIEEAKKLNNTNDAGLVAMLKHFMSNQNYRADYNKRKTQLAQMLKNDPVVLQRVAELKKAK